MGWLGFTAPSPRRRLPEEEVCWAEREEYEKVERGFGVRSFVFIRKEEEVYSECFRKKTAGREGI